MPVTTEKHKRDGFGHITADLQRLAVVCLIMNVPTEGSTQATSRCSLGVMDDGQGIAAGQHVAAMTTVISLLSSDKLELTSATHALGVRDQI